MNAPFDAASVAHEAAEKSKRCDRSETIILDPKAPLNNAREFIVRRYMCGSERTLHHQQGCFFLWNGMHYAELQDEEIRSATYKFLDAAYRPDRSGAPVPFDPTRSKVSDLLEALAAEVQLPGSVRPPSWLDDRLQPPAAEIVVCTNGLLHLPARALLPHSPSFFGLNALGYAYTACAPQPKEWLQFLATLWPKDPESITTLQDIFGILLTAETRYQKLFLMVGPKRSGKGTIARIATALVGRENVAGPTLSSLSENFGLAPLMRKPLAIVSDARLGGRADAHTIAERLLAISGEDTLSVPRKFRDDWTGRLPTRFLILSNELPRLTDASGALAGRFIILTLQQSFYGREDLGLTDRLLAELPGILNWALAGRDRLAKRGYFVQPASSRQAIEELEDLASPIGAFLRERCIVDAGRCVECGRLFEAWTNWCRDHGRDRPGTTQLFGRDLRAVVPGLSVANVRQGDGSRRRYYQGLDLDPDKVM